VTVATGTSLRAVLRGLLSLVPSVALLVALGVPALAPHSAGTSIVHGAGHVYDAPAVARVDVHEFAAADAGTAMHSDVWVWSASPSPEARGTTTTLASRSVATDTGHAESGSRPAPGLGEPNSIWEQIRADGTRSVTYYDEAGRPYAREDYGQRQGHGTLDPSTPHEHRVTFNERGQVNGHFYRELDANGKPVGPWIAE
jgi:hypothetical protein